MKVIANAGVESGTHFALLKAHEHGTASSNQTLAGGIDSRLPLGSNASEDAGVRFTIRIDGKETQLNHSMLATATLGDLRQAIETQFQSSLTFGIKELKRYPAGSALTDDAETLDALAYKPVHGAYMVEVVPAQFPSGLKIVVRDPQGKETLLNHGFSLDETVGDLKIATEEQFFFEVSAVSKYPSQEVLYTREHNDTAELATTLGQHGYRNMDDYAQYIVDVVPFPANHVSDEGLNFRVKIRTTGGMFAMFGNKIEQEVFLGCPVSPEATVGHLMMLIQRKFGEPVRGLKSYPMDEQLDPERRLSSYSYGPGPNIVYIVTAVTA